MACRFLSWTDHALALPLSQPLERTFDSSDEKNIISTAGVADVSRSLDAELEIASVCPPRDLEPSARRGVLQEESVIDARYHRKCPFDEYLRVTPEEGASAHARSGR